MLVHVYYMLYTTVNIGQEFLEKLGNLAIKDKRSKTQELHQLIDDEYKRRDKNN